ncbi:MAG: tetratricopeptide repeat protein [Holophaga sp.]|nr:tetratricopeptide repeat protein [Holophaga sp.]
MALSYRVEHLKAAFRAGDPAAIQAAVQDVELLRRTYGTLDVLPLVDAMAVFARQLGREGNPALGLQVVQSVDSWAPNDPALLGTKVILMRRQGLHGYLWSVADVMELTRSRLAHPVHRWLWALQHLAWVRLMATLMLWGWALCLALRYRRVFRYLWEDPLRRWRINRHVAAFLGAFLVTLPVILGLDPSVVAMLWLWLLAPFMLPLEIRVTVFLVLLQLVHPALAVLEPMAAGRPSPSIVALQLRPQPLPENPRALAALAPEDRAFLAGWRQLELQNWARAELSFKALVPGHRDHAAVLNNLGVARFQLGDLAGAKTCFDQAVALAPGAPELLLNQSVVAFKQMDSPLGSAKQAEADRAAPESYNRMVVANHARKEQRTFAMPLPDTPARIQALSAALPGTGRVLGRMEELVLLFNLLLPLLAALAILLRVRRSVNEAHPSQCVRCGDPFHTTDSTDTSICSKCYHLFTLKDGLHGGSRKRKVDEVAYYQKTQRVLHRMLMVLLPGTDRAFVGDTWGGFVEYGFFCFALGIVLVTGRSVRYPGEILADPASLWLPVGLALLAVLCLRSWLKLLPRRH